MKENILKEMDLVDIQREKLAGIGDWQVLFGTGRVIGLYTGMNGSNYRNIDFTCKTYISGFIAGHFCNLRCY